MTETATMPSIASAIPPGYSAELAYQAELARRARITQLAKPDPGIMSPAEWRERRLSQASVLAEEANAATMRRIAFEEERALAAAHAARRLFDDAFPQRITMEKIIRTVSQFYGVSRVDLLSARRAGSIVLPRHICAYLAKQLTLLSYPQIARRLNRLEHTSQLHACRRIERLVKTDDQVGADVARMIEILDQGAPKPGAVRKITALRETNSEFDAHIVALEAMLRPAEQAS